MHLSGVIFDFDGTLANTIPICCAAFRAALAPVTGRQYHDAEIIALFGPSEEGIIRNIVGDNWETAHAAFLRAYALEHRACPAPFDGVVELLEDLQRRGIRLAVVTGKGRTSAEISLTYLGLATAFDIVEAGHPDGGVKPDAIGRVVARWNLPPERVAYVGDAPSDMHDARLVRTIPLAAAWAETSDVDALNRANPHALFRTVQELAVWLEQHARG